MTMLSNKLLLLIVLPLLIFNCLVISQNEIDLNRWSRLISTGLIFILLLLQNSYSKKVLSIFILFLISDVFMFFYENIFFNALTFLVKISAYTLLTFVVVPELKKIKTNLFQKILFMAILGLNLAMLVTLVEMVPEKFIYPYLDILFFAYGMAMMAMVITAISYSNRYASNPSFYYTAAALFVVFSDITSFIAYYLEFYEFFYADRIFYVLSLLVLVKFASLERDHAAVTELENI